MRASRSVGKRAAQGLRSLASKAKGDANSLKDGQAAAKAAPAAKATPTAPAPPKAPPKATAAAAEAAAASTQVPKLPTASPAVGPASKGSEGGQWIIHPAVPVDARLLGAGLAGAGLLIYNLSASGKEEEAAAPAAVVAVVEEEEGGSAAQESGEGGALLADVAPQHVDEGFSLLQQPAQQAEGAAQKRQQEDHEEEHVPPTVVDGSKVLAVIEEVLTLDATHLLQQAHAQPAPEAKAEVAEAAEGGEAEPQVKAGAAAPGKGHHRGGRGGKGGKGTGGSVEVVDVEALAAIQAGLANTAGEALASDLGKAPPKPDKAAAAVEPPPEEVAVGVVEVLPPQSLRELGPNVAQASSALAGVDPLVKEILGIQQDVTPAGLIQQAAAHGQGAGEDWVQYRHRHRQAVADAQFIAALLDAAARNVEGVLEEKDKHISQGREALEAAQAALRRQGDQFRDLLKDALEDADRQAKAALKLQAQQLAVAHAEVTVRERAERAAKVDEVRTKLNALEEAFTRRSNERRTSTEVHKISVGAFALQAALESGQPLRGALEYLSKACKDDPLVLAALAVLPSAAAERGVLTREQISAGLEDVQRASRQLCWVPEGQGGLLTVTLAKLASKLKVPERGSVAASIPGEGIDRSLAVVQSEFVNGQLLKAAADLEAAVAGTAAAAEVAPWVAAVRSRVLAEQTAELLQAHASALAVSLA